MVVGFPSAGGVRDLRVSDAVSRLEEGHRLQKVDRRTNMLFSHAVLRKGLVHSHGPQELLEDLQKLGYYETFLGFGGEPASRRVQEEVKRRREGPTILDNFGVGNIQTNGVAEIMCNLSENEFAL